MDCPKCNKSTCVLVTSQAKKKVRERTSFLIWTVRIVFFPFWLVYRLFVGRKATYYKTQNWHCNYCNHDFPQNLSE